MVSIAIPLTISKLGNYNKGLGALKPQTYKTDFKVSPVLHVNVFLPQKMHELMLIKKYWF